MAKKAKVSKKAKVVKKVAKSPKKAVKVAKKESKKATPKKSTKLGKALTKGLKQAKKHKDGVLELRTTTREVARPVFKDPPEKSTIPDYEGSRSELFQEIKEKLIKMRATTLESMRQRAEENKEDADNAGSNSGDEGDQAQSIMQASIQKSLTANDETKLKQIEIALDKISKGTYGICIDTEEEIEAKRLLANPFALRCIAAQAEIEQAQRQHKSMSKGGSMRDMDDSEGPASSDDE